MGLGTAISSVSRRVVRLAAKHNCTHPVAIAYSCPHHAPLPSLAGTVLQVDDTADSVIQGHLGSKLRGHTLVKQASDKFKHVVLHWGQLRPEHLAHRGFPQQQHAIAIPRQGLQEGLQQLGVVHGRGDKPGAAAMDLVRAGEHLGPARQLARLGIPVRRRHDALRPHVRQRVPSKGGVVHPERPEDVRSHVLAQCLPGDFLNDVAGPVDARTVVPPLARGEFQGQVPGLNFARDVFILASNMLGPAVQVRVGVGIAKARGVGEQDPVDPARL